MAQYRLQMPKLHPGQMRVRSEAKRFNVLCCARRWGKTTFGIDTIMHPALAGFPVAWFGPTYKNISDTWRQLIRAFKPITVRKLETEHRLELITGGALEMWSLDKDDVARGRKYKLVVIDEAAMVPNLVNAWDLVIRPTLIDLKGSAWFMSTPRGMNGFKMLFDRGQDVLRANWASWQAPTLDNPFISQEEIEEQRRDSHELAFAQEVLAQFVSFEGAVFRNVMTCATAELQTGPKEHHEYVFGIDWGKQLDYTVVVVIDAVERSVVAMERWGAVDYVVQRDRLKAMHERWKPSAVIAESNSIGAPMIEQLWRDGMPVHPFTTTNTSKAMAVEGLSLAFERCDIRILPEPELLTELQAFEAQRLPSGLTRYAAPAGQHDDCVMALAIGWSAIESYAPQQSMLIYEDRVQISAY